MSRQIRPKRDAFLFAATYFFLMTTWILVSTLIASSISASVEEMKAIETYKGIGSMGFMAIVLYVGALWAFRRNAETAAQLVTSQQKLVQAEREAISGLFASSVAHDIANLMTIQRLGLERLKTTPNLPEVAIDSVERLDRVTIRLTDIVTRLRSAGRSLFKSPPRSFDVSVAVRDTIKLMRNHDASRECEISYQGPDRLELTGYPVLIHQLVMNLVLNAAEATDGHGRILVELSARDIGVEIAVNDDGPGVSDLVKDAIFQSFYTTKLTGSGLGLTSVRSSVDIHGGRIEVSRSARLGGARFIVTLPPLDERRMSDFTPDKISESKTKLDLPSSPLLG